MIRQSLQWLLYLPLQLALWVLFLLSEGLRLLLALAPRRPHLSRDIPLHGDPLCSIIVLNWNGRRLLEESLPALEQAVRFTGREHEIMVVDNGSRDDSREWLQRHYPRVKLVLLEENLGFGEGNNRGVEAARHPIVVLLNNDMIVERDFLPPLLDAFCQPDVFAVSSQIFFPPGKRREETGNTQARFRHGYLELSHQPLRACHHSRRHLPVLWAGGGSSAFHRERFLRLGGFSPLFSPCYVEDTDLSYRAWRRGWKVLLAAHSRVLHKHRSSSSSRFSEEKIAQLTEERKLWYLWKNYSLKTLWSHLLLLPFRLGRSPLSVTTYLGALRKLPQVFASRLREPRRRVSDQVLFRWIRHPLLYLDHFFPHRAQPCRDELRILIVSAYLPVLGHHGGAGRVFQLLHRTSRKHQVSVIAFVETEEEAAGGNQLLPHCRRVETVLRKHYLPVSPFPFEPFEEFNTAEFRDRLEELLAEEDFDVVHFEWTQMAQYADLVPHIPKLMTEIEVNYAAHQTLVDVETNPLKKVRKFYNTLQTLYREVELCRRVDTVVCVTDKDRDFLLGYVDPRRLAVINTGVDTEYFSPDGAASPEPDSLLYVGAFRHQPNVDAMLYFCERVYPLILKERPGTRLYIVGSSPPPSIRALARRSGITVTGYVDDIRPYYRRAQVVVVPLRTGVGIRGKILEAWASGRAVVATSQACLGLRAHHGGNLLISDGAEEFAAWTLALLRHPEHCRRLGEAGRKTAVRFYDWSLLGDQMVRCYERLAGRPSCPGSRPVPQSSDDS